MASLRELRRFHQIPQRAVAEALGVSQPAVVKLERRVRDPRLSTVMRYLDAIGYELWIGPRARTDPELWMRLRS